MRIFPEMWPSTVCPFSSFTRNVALGRFSRISPCIWITSSLDMEKSCRALLYFSAGFEIGLLQQRLVLLAHHVALHLSPEVHRHHDDDQQRGATEIKRH